MDLFDELVKPPTSSWSRICPGDLQFCNNHVAMHARTAFEDYPEPERAPAFVRLWLSVPNSRRYRRLGPHYGTASRGRPRRFQPRTPGRMVFETSGAEN